MSAQAKTSADPRGLKRICTACSVRFYDMGKRPIICPSCDEEFTGEVKIRTRKAKSAIIKDDVAKAIKAKAMEESSQDELEEETEDEAQIVSLEDDNLKDSAADEEEETASPDLNLDAGIGDLDDVEVGDDSDDDDNVDPDVAATEEAKDA